MPTLYLDRNSENFKDYRTAEIAKEKQIRKSSIISDNDDNKNFLIFKCKFCERSYSEGPMFEKHLSEVHNVSGPEYFNVHKSVSNQEFLDSIGLGPTVSYANKFVKTTNNRQIHPNEQEDDDSMSIPPTIIKVNVANHETVDEVVSKIIAGTAMNETVGQKIKKIPSKKLVNSNK